MEPETKRAIIALTVIFFGVVFGILIGWYLLGYFPLESRP